MKEELMMTMGFAKVTQFIKMCEYMKQTVEVVEFHGILQCPIAGF